MDGAPPFLAPFDEAADLPSEVCEICDARIEEPRIAVGLKTCWRCAPADRNSPPWEIEPHG